MGQMGQQPDPACWSGGSMRRAAMTSREVSLSEDGSGSARATAAMSSACWSLPVVAGRAARRRIRSRQALTTIRCSQVVTAESPRKLDARRKAEIIAS